jgi:UDP-3-O-acyl-N-acetylglucosamine deacetylase
VLERDWRALRRAGWIKGGPLESAVVVRRGSASSTTSRCDFPDEFVRHKILDLLGDLFLLGGPLIGT